MSTSTYISAVKCLLFTFNFLCLILGIATITYNTFGLQTAKLGSDEHAYFIVGIILGSLVCMTTFIGCYGIVCELVGVNIVYMVFLFMLLTVQYLQMRNYTPNTFFNSALQHLQYAWENIETQPLLMATVEKSYDCCAIESSHDYSYLSRIIPASCYHSENPQIPENRFDKGCRQALELSYQSAVKREHIFQLSVIVVECIALSYALTLVISIYVQRRGRILENAHPVRGYVDRSANHVGSRTLLIPH